MLILLFLVSSQHIAQAKQFNVLLFTKTVDWHHESIHDAVTAMRNLSEKHDFALQWHEDSTRFNDKFLAQFDVIVLINTSGDIFTDDQQEAFQRFIQAGKGFVGVHSAAYTEYEWPWYGKLIGHYFLIHPENQSAILQNVDATFPGMQGFHEQHL